MEVVKVMNWWPWAERQQGTKKALGGSLGKRPQPSSYCDGLLWCKKPSIQQLQTDSVFCPSSSLTNCTLWGIQMNLCCVSLAVNNSEFLWQELVLKASLQGSDQSSPSSVFILCFKQIQKRNMLKSLGQVGRISTNTKVVKCLKYTWGQAAFLCSFKQSQCYFPW